MCKKIPFDRLPDKVGGIPQLYHPIPVQRPPVYDTEKLLQPLMVLADYLSPYKRALRKAAIAKANAEYRDNMPGGRNEQLWWFRQQQLDLEKKKLAMEEELLPLKKRESIAEVATKEWELRNMKTGGVSPEVLDAFKKHWTEREKMAKGQQESAAAAAADKKKKESSSSFETPATMGTNTPDYF